MLTNEMMVRDVRGMRQRQVFAWIMRCFGRKVAVSLEERAARLFEEATELSQAAGLPKDLAVRILDDVYSKPKGEIAQEVGGVSTTLLALCQNQGLNADTCEREELERIIALPPEHFRDRHKRKENAGLTMSEAA